MLYKGGIGPSIFDFLLSRSVTGPVVTGNRFWSQKIEIVTVKFSSFNCIKKSNEKIKLISNEFKLIQLIKDKEILMIEYWNNIINIRQMSIFWLSWLNKSYRNNLFFITVLILSFEFFFFHFVDFCTGHISFRFLGYGTVTTKFNISI